MRNPTSRWCSLLIPMCLVWLSVVPDVTYANTTVRLEQPTHFTTAEGSNVILTTGAYTLDAAQEWLRVTPSGGSAIDSLLLDAHVGTHEESLTEPFALSTTGVQADVQHLVLLLLNGKSLEATGSYSGIRSRGRSSIDLQRILALAKKKKAQNTEFVTPSFGGRGGNRSYNLDCGNRAVLIGSTYKAGLWFDAIGIICQRVNARTGELESEFTRGPVGGSGGLARIARCSQGRVAQGIRVKSGQYINRISIRCSRWEPSRKAPIVGQFCNPNSPACADFGGQMSAPESDLFLCPQGKVGKALRGKHGSYIDNMKFVCDFWDK